MTIFIGKCLACGWNIMKGETHSHKDSDLEECTNCKNKKVKGIACPKCGYKTQTLASG